MSCIFSSLFYIFLFSLSFNFLSMCRFLQQSLRNKSLQMSDYKIALLCNAYSTNSECFTLPMGVLVETIYGNGNMRISLPGTSCMASGSITPLPMNLLDSLTVHAKMRYSIVNKRKVHKDTMCFVWYWKPVFLENQHFNIFKCMLLNVMKWFDFFFSPLPSPLPVLFTALLPE